MWRGISLANKCLLLFGAAVVLIIVAALIVPYMRMNAVVDEGQLETSRQLVAAWEARARETGDWAARDQQLADGRITVLSREEAAERAEADAFVRRALRRLAEPGGSAEFHRASWVGTERLYAYARAVTGAEGSLAGLILLERVSEGAAGQLLVNASYLFSAGLIAGGVAVLVFYFITNRLILSPVRSLRATAEQVREGDISTRSEIATGDEFEELADTFNNMLEELARSQDQLRAINASLDLRVNELAERNITLFEANRVKGEFLASVSHELRTPLNSIIGFAELLLEIAEREEDAGDDSSRLLKRKRYIENIVTSGRSLLEMINSLLDMAKIEAGKMELRIEPMNLRDSCEALAALIRPLADKQGVQVVVETSDDLPLIETDVKKLQQVIFNLLSNAVKFTGDTPSAYPEGAADGPDRREAPGGTGGGAGPGAEGGGGRPKRVVLRAERLVARGGGGGASPRPPADGGGGGGIGGGGGAGAGEDKGAHERVRISVLDTGPGISADDQKLIFDKFRQLESGHTRRHAGTGLGLAICRELTAMLQGEIQLESEVGRGSMFSVILPVRVDPGRASEHRLEMAFRGSLTAAARDRSP